MALASGALAQSTIGDGKIDNFIIDSSVHLVSGVVVIVAMVTAVGLVARCALGKKPIDTIAKVSLGVAQVALIWQLLLGIKLLDQGQGIVQLYIHYIGGLLPLGGFLGAAWFARGDNPKSSKILASILFLSCLSALMAFFIGRAYVNG